MITILNLHKFLDEVILESLTKTCFEQKQTNKNDINSLCDLHVQFAQCDNVLR